MAAEGIPASFEREIECSICHDPFEDPRSLACFHTFCFECVQRLAEGSRVVLCPLCRKKTALPNNGAMGLAKNNLAHVMVEFVTKHGTDDKGVLMCQSEHEVHRKAEFFCQSCKSVICASCGMTLHRDPHQHQTFPIAEKLTKMQEDLQQLLEWGRSEEREQVERKQLLELKQQEVTTRFIAVEADIDHTFAEQRKLLQERESHLKQDLWDMKRAIKTALQKRCNAEEEAEPISDLNSLTEDILAGGAGAVMEMHQEILDGYQSQKEGVARVDAVGSLEQLSEFISAIRFEKEPRKDIPTVGRIVPNTGHWTVEQVRFAVDSNCCPSSIIELSTGFIAVGFGVERDIELFDKSCQRYRSLGPMAVKDMAPLPNDFFLVLCQDGYVSRVSVSQNLSACLLRGLDLLSNEMPLFIAADESRKFTLLFEDRVQSYSKEGVLEHTIKHSFDLGDGPCRMQFNHDSARSGGNKDRHLEILTYNAEKTVRALRCELKQNPRVTTTYFDLLDEADGRLISCNSDREGNLYAAFSQEDTFITIKRYLGGDRSKGEVVIDDLQVEMEDGDTVLLKPLGPSCLAMCTSKKLSIFKKGTVDDFLNGIGLAR